MNHFASDSIIFPYSIRNIPFVRRSSMLSVIDYLNTMSLVAHVTSKFRDLTYDKFCIEDVHCIPTTSTSDVLFNYAQLSILTINLAKCKEWIGSIMAMRGARLKQLTSKAISTLLFKDPLQTFKKFSEYFYILC
jgi:hypothetical protein